jgi:histidinol-phosphate aminotransferase
VSARVPDFSALAAAAIRGLRAYDPGLDIVALRRSFPRGQLVELGSNENSYGASPLAKEALLACIHDLHRYPDPLGGDLKRALAQLHGVSTAQIQLGNGSHELLMQIAQAFAGPGRHVLASQYGFAVYAIAAKAVGAEFEAAPAFPGDARMPWGHDLAGLAAHVREHTAIIYLANPNNPTGTWFPTVALASLMTQVPPEVLVVVDEAYLEYVTDPALQSAIWLTEHYPNLIVTRTFSKAYGLAGLRVGYLVAHAEAVRVLERLRESFNVGIPGLVGAQAALLDPAHVVSVRERTTEQRRQLAEGLQELGVGVLPSQTNFLLCNFGRPAGPIEAGLVARGVVPRPMVGYGLPTCLRLTVAQPEENRRLLQALGEVIA